MLTGRRVSGGLLTFLPRLSSWNWINCNTSAASVLLVGGSACRYWNEKGHAFRSERPRIPASGRKASDKCNIDTTKKHGKHVPSYGFSLATSWRPRTCLAFQAIRKISRLDCRPFSDPRPTSLRRETDPVSEVNSETTNFPKSSDCEFP